MEQNITVADIRSQDNQAELLRLKEQNAVLERAQLAVLFVALEAAKYPRQQRSTSENLGVRRKDTMWWHRSDLLADHVNDSGSSRVGWIQYADRVHQFLDRDSRVIDLSLRDQIVQDLRRTILHLIDVNGGIKQEPLPADKARIDERQLIVTSSCQRSFRIEARPPPGSVEIELRHLKNRASASGRSCHETP